jgi:two-component system chemotaxis response regulator CheB
LNPSDAWPGKLTTREIIVVGGSAGGADAISALLRHLRADMRAAVFVVCHLLPDAKNHLVDALNTAGPLVAKTPEDGEEIRHGLVYVAPPDRRLLVKPGYVRLTRGPAKTAGGLLSIRCFARPRSRMATA